MIYKCPNCDTALIFDPEENRLVCPSCDSRFRPEEIDIDYLPKLRINFHIYSCTACGAEIMVKENEAATYCVYCGQPVIVFDRVSSELQPDYIIPFKITKEAAQLSLRHSMRKKFFVPKQFKNFQIDTLRGIYIPFWLYDIDYHDRQYFSVSGKILGGAAQKTRGYLKEVRTVFKDFPINASHALDDEELQLLGKYDLKEMVPFHTGYLSGFYADRYDMDFHQASGQVLEKAEKIYDFEMKQSLYKKGYDTVIREYKSPEATIQRIRYALLPVWFMTFRYKEHPYTLLVNGQTGSAAGNLPIKKSRALLLFSFFSAITAPIFVLMAYLCHLAYKSGQIVSPWQVGLLFVFYFFFVFTGLALGRVGLKSIKKGLRFSRSAGVRSFVRERQDVIS